MALIVYLWSLHPATRNNLNILQPTIQLSKQLQTTVRGDQREKLAQNLDLAWARKSPLRSDFHVFASLFLAPLDLVTVLQNVTSHITSTREQSIFDAFESFRHSNRLRIGCIAQRVRRDSTSDQWKWSEREENCEERLHQQWENHSIFVSGNSRL